MRPLKYTFSACLAEALPCYHNDHVATFFNLTRCELGFRFFVRSRLRAKFGRTRVAANNSYKSDNDLGAPGQ